MIGWAHPNLLHLTVLLPVVALVAVLLYWRRRRDAAERLADAPLLARLAGADLHRFPLRRGVLVVGAAAALGVAAAGPRWGSPLPEDPDEDGADVVLVLDVSNSMLVRDAAPDRMAAQRAAGRELLRRMHGGRVGIVVFGGSAHVLSPLTTDFTAVQMYLDALSPEMAFQGGSAASGAIRQAVRLLQLPGEPGGRGSLLLVSDGEWHEDDDAVGLAIAEAAAARVPVHALAVGTEAGGPVPDVDPATGDTVGYKREPVGGEIAISRMEPERMRWVADGTGGEFRDAREPAAVAELAGYVRAGGGGPRGAPVPGNRYAWFVALAMGLLALDTVGEARRRGRAAGKEG